MAKIEVDINIVNLKKQMDAIIKKVKEVDYSVAELDELEKIQTQELKDKFNVLREKLQKDKEQALTQLRVLLPQVNPKETKTQFSSELPNGKVVLKKASKDFDYNKDMLLKWALENNRQDLIKQTVTKSFNWSNFKSQLAIENDNIVDIETGEILAIEGLEIKQKDEVIEVK